MLSNLAKPFSFQSFSYRAQRSSFVSSNVCLFDARWTNPAKFLRQFFQTVPVELELGFADGTSQTVKLPVEIWYNGNRYVYRVPPGRTVVSARVNPDGLFPDVNTANDGWTAPTGTTP